MSSGVARLVVLDDDRLLRESIAHVLNAEPDLDVVAHTEVEGDGDMPADWERWQPELIVIDPGTAGSESTWPGQLARLPAGVPVIVLSALESDESLFVALRAGVAGYVLKNGSSDDLLRAIRTVVEGGSVLAPSVTRRLIARFSTPVDPRREVIEHFHLTDRELDVLTGLCRGETNAQIAGRLGIGVTTVKSHVASLLNKIACHSRLEAVVFAYEHGIAPTHRPAPWTT